MAQALNENWKMILALCGLASTAMLSLITAGILLLVTLQVDMRKEFSEFKGNVGAKVLNHEKRLDRVETKIDHHPSGG